MSRGSVLRGWVPRRVWVPQVSTWVGEYPGEWVSSQGIEWVPRGCDWVPRGSDWVPVGEYPVRCLFSGGGTHPHYWVISVILICPWGWGGYLWSLVLREVGVSTQEVGMLRGSVLMVWAPRRMWVSQVSTWVGEYPGEWVSTQGSEWVPRGSGWVPRGSDWVPMGEYPVRCLFSGGGTHPRYWVISVILILATTKTCIVGKREVCILLECFFLFCIFHLSK